MKKQKKPKPKKRPVPLDSDLRKGAIESDQRADHTQVSMTGQLPHRTDNTLIKQSDTDFPEPGGNPEHSGEPESK